ncbi:HdeD family acid-resistance protein [Actinomycetospora chlora]|uniref:HdeD family acid-resistance protein n=1 Tax=Actinomycetospora chlora TaxID=663608 RepID=A0ABP9ANJ5_9PSEU
MTTTMERRRTGWDVVLGILLLLAGLFVLGNAVIATYLSVLLLGWFAIGAGVVTLVGAFVRREAGISWSAALGGAVLIVLGVIIVRDPLAGATGLTLLAGALFLVVGLTRLIVASQVPAARTVLIISGFVSIVLGLIVLFNLQIAVLSLLGLLLGVQILVEGITILVAGRLRPAPTVR